MCNIHGSSYKVLHSVAERGSGWCHGSGKKRRPVSHITIFEQSVSARLTQLELNGPENTEGHTDL